MCFVVDYCCVIHVLFFLFFCVYELPNVGYNIGVFDAGFWGDINGNNFIIEVFNKDALSVCIINFNISHYFSFIV